MKLSLPLLAATAVITLNSAIDALNVKLRGINYSSATGADWLPFDQRCKNSSEVQKDMNLLATIAETVRIYSLTGCNLGALILPAAKTAGIKVHLGIWTTPSHDQLVNEKNALGKMIDSGNYDSNVVGLFVGSEAIYRKNLTADAAIGFMGEIRDYIRGRNINTPVTIADVIDVYTANPQLVDAVDYVSVNQFSFWEGVDVTEAGAVTLDRLKNLRIAAANKGKKMVISETGWSSGGSDPAASVATPENQVAFFSDFYQLARSHDFEYYWFVAYDSKWRVAAGAKEVEDDFGIFNMDRTMKSTFQQLVVPTYPPKLIHSAATNLYLSGDPKTVFMTSLSNDMFLSEQQVWFFDTATQQVRSKGSDRCLDAYQPWDGGIVHIYRCIPTENNQKWKYNKETGQFTHAVHLGFCLDVDPAQNNLVQLYGCSPNNQHQQWSVINPNP